MDASKWGAGINHKSTPSMEISTYILPPKSNALATPSLFRHHPGQNSKKQNIRPIVNGRLEGRWVLRLWGARRWGKSDLQFERCVSKHQELMTINRWTYRFWYCINGGGHWEYEYVSEDRIASASNGSGQGVVGDGGKFWWLMLCKNVSNYESL